MYKQLKLPFETIDELFNKYEFICQEKEKLMLAIWDMQNDCIHSWGEFRHILRPNPAYKESDDDFNCFNWNAEPKEISEWTRTCKICRYKRIYSDTEYWREINKHMEKNIEKSEQEIKDGKAVILNESEFKDKYLKEKLPAPPENVLIQDNWGETRKK